jgi:SPP1 gp7 family putative phage head morphogenesis protein
MSSAAGSDHRHQLTAATTGGTDPTRTKTVRRTYAQRLRGGFADINTEIRRGVRERDVFGLAQGEIEGVIEVLAAVDPLPSMFNRRQDTQIETFEDWLDRMQAENVLNVIGRNENRFIESGYERGLKHANGSLRRGGITPDETDVEVVIRRPVHRDTLQTIYTRDFSDLKNITGEVSTQVTRELTEGFAVGEGPADIARRITDRVDRIGKTRATVMARTSVIDAHAAATLNRYEEHDAVEGVTVQAEHVTAGDSRVCPECAALEGEVYTLQEARGVIPVHPQCRCTFQPIGNLAAAAAVQAHPDAFHTLFSTGAFAGTTGQSRYEVLAATDAAGAQELVASAV